MYVVNISCSLHLKVLQDLEQMDVSGEVVDPSGTVMNFYGTLDASGNLIYPPPPPDVLTMADILGEHSVLVAKEQADGDAIRSFGTMSVLGLKPVFVEWASKGFPDNYPLLTVQVSPPPLCSDGVARSLPDYIEYCSGTSLAHQIEILQAKLPDIRVAYANLGGSLAAILSRV
jgi:hypothetical protein